jgi:hypothetical protein
MNNMENLKVFEKTDYALIIISIITLIIGILMLNDLPILAGAFLGFSLSVIPLVIYSAHERKGHKKRQIELKKEIEILQKLIDDQMMPIYMNAIKLGETFAFVGGKDPVTLRTLNISDNEFVRAKQSNDYQSIINILKAKYGEKAGESFLLGYQLTILSSLKPQNLMDDNIAKLLKNRLALLTNILIDEDLINSTNRMIDRIMKKDPVDKETNLNTFFRVLLWYLTMPNCRNQKIRQFLLDAPYQKHLALPNNREKKKEVSIKLLEVIKSHVQDDPNVNLFYFILKDNSEGVKKAMDAGANPMTRDTDIIGKYKILLEKECPNDLERFYNIDEGC